MTEAFSWNASKRILSWYQRTAMAQHQVNVLWTARKHAVFQVHTFFFSRGGHSPQSSLTILRFMSVDPADSPRQMLFLPREKYFAVVWCATIQSSGHYKVGIILRNTRKTNPNWKYMNRFIGNTWNNKTEIHELIFNKTSGFALSLLKC